MEALKLAKTRKMAGRKNLIRYLVIVNGNAFIGCNGFYAMLYAGLKTGPIKIEMELDRGDNRQPVDVSQ